MHFHIFDLDGVLIEARAYHYSCLNQALNAAGYGPISMAEHNERFEGLPTAVKLQMLESEGRIKASDCQFIKALKQHFTLSQTSNIPYVDIAPAIIKLSINPSNRLAVASNAKVETIVKFLDTFHLRHYFQVIVGNDHNSNPKPKPAPDIYELAIKGCEKTCPIESMLILPPPPVITVYEDSDVGEQAARAAGVERVVRVTDPRDLIRKLGEQE